MKGIVANLAFAALLGFCFTIPAAHADDLYVSVGVILKFNSSGNQSTFASSGLDIPTGLALDSGGNLYVANGGNNTIEEFNSSASGSVFATASSGLNFPIGLAFDTRGDLFVANSGNNTIEEFNLSRTGQSSPPPVRA